MKLLLLEDDRQLRAAYANRLRSAGGDVDEVGTLADAQQALGHTTFDCLVLDRLVPDGDAITLVGSIDRRLDRPPVLMISGLGDPGERLDGLRIGADDYLAKPFRLEELALRVRNLVGAAPRRSGVTDLGRLRLDRHGPNVTWDGTRIRLTSTQFKIFEKLALHIGSAVTTDELHDHCWDPGDVRLTRHVVFRHVSSLRRVLETVVGSDLTIESARGVGYTLQIQP